MLRSPGTWSVRSLLSSQLLFAWWLQAGWPAGLGQGKRRQVRETIDFRLVEVRKMRPHRLLAGSDHSIYRCGSQLGSAQA